MNDKSVLEIRIEEFISSIEKALDNQNWHAALTTAVTLPDICCRLDGTKPGDHSRIPYSKWFDHYVSGDKLDSPFRDEPLFFNNGSNAYAFRCAFLHNGDGDLLSHRARDANLDIDAFEFVVDDTAKKNESGVTLVFSAGIDDRKLVLNIEVYCNGIVQGVRRWLEDYKGVEDVQERARKMIEFTLKSKYEKED